MMFQILFSLPGCCFSCNCSAAAFNLSCRSSSGIHFRAVGLLIPNSFAHLDTLPSGFFLYQASTCCCCVGAARWYISTLMTSKRALRGSEAGFSLITAAGSHRQQKEQTAGTHGRVFVGCLLCVRCQYSVFITTLYILAL